MRFARSSCHVRLSAIMRLCGLLVSALAVWCHAAASQQLTLLPLAERGPYCVGTHTVVWEDATRAGRKVGVTLWYPALTADGARANALLSNAAPDVSGAPYPLILSSSTVAKILAPHLVSHGFAWASVDGIDSYRLMNTQMVDQPLDILFALSQVGAAPPESLMGVMDADHAGVIGYSFDGYNALAMSGARVDAEYYLAQCPTPDAVTKTILSGLSAFDCGPARAWDGFVAHAGEAITRSEDGLWQPMTDVRIRAVMPMAAEGWWLFGERGLAAADRPVLVIAGTADLLYPENALIFDNLGAPDKTFISFVGRNHMMIINTASVARMAHFAVAFFGYHLQGREALQWYFSEEFVDQYGDLFWGVVADGS